MTLKGAYRVRFRLLGTTSFSGVSRLQPETLIRPNYTIEVEVVARLGGDDSWNTCRGCAWCGARQSWIPDQLVCFRQQLSSKNRGNSVVKSLVSGISFFSTDVPCSAEDPHTCFNDSLKSETEVLAKHYVLGKVQTMRDTWTRRLKNCIPLLLDRSDLAHCEADTALGLLTVVENLGQ